MDKSQRKELANAYKLAFPSMGIFSVKNTVTGKQLIGQSNNLPAILNRHRLELRTGAHRNAALMADWLLFGEAQFSFDVLEQLTQRPAPDFDYSAELDKYMVVWRTRVPTGSEMSYL